MSVYTIQNGTTIATIHSIGAEVTSLELLGEKVLYQGNQPKWSSCAPVLFPTVGRSYDNQIEVDGQSYPMPMHGFAKQREFELTWSDGVSAEFHLRSDSETRKYYPWEFDLKIVHTVSGESLTTEFQVTNLDQSPMYFALGGHPAVCCDLDRGGYELRFEGEEDCLSTQVSPQGIIQAGNTAEVANREKRIIPLNRDLFRIDALIFENVRSSYVELVDLVQERTVRFSFDGFDDLAAWTLPAGYDAPFICLEPWQGMGNRTGEGKELQQRHGIQKLEPGQAKVMSYSFCLKK